MTASAPGAKQRFERGVNRAALALARAAPGMVVAILGLVVLLTVAGPLLADAAPGATAAIRKAFFLSCHQIPERCLRIGPGIAPVCARCQAIYAGMFAAGLAALAGVPRRAIPFWALVLATLPIAIDGFSALVGLRSSTALLRVLTGGLWGLALGAFALPLLRQGFAEAAADLSGVPRRAMGKPAASDPPPCSHAT